MLVGRLAQLGHAHMSATGSALAVASKAAGASTAMAAAAPAASTASTASAVAAGASATAAAAGTTAASISGAAAAAAQSAASFGVSMAGLVRALCFAFAASSSKVGFWRALGAVLRTSGESLGRGLSLALKSKLVSDLRIAWANMDVLHHAVGNLVRIYFFDFEKINFTSCRCPSLPSKHSIVFCWSDFRSRCGVEWSHDPCALAAGAP